MWHIADLLQDDLLGDMTYFCKTYSTVAIQLAENKAVVEMAMLLCSQV